MFQKTCDGPMKVAPLRGKIKNFWGHPQQINRYPRCDSY
jgi:hypothetical protein